MRGDMPIDNLKLWQGMRSAGSQIKHLLQN